MSADTFPLDSRPQTCARSIPLRHKYGEGNGFHRRHLSVSIFLLIDPGWSQSHLMWRENKDRLQGSVTPHREKIYDRPAAFWLLGLNFENTADERQV